LGFTQEKKWAEKAAFDSQTDFWRELKIASTNWLAP
jgi:hypothetical protein